MRPSKTQSGYQCDLVIKEAKLLPKLGLVSSPSSYVIVQIGDGQSLATSGIVYNSCNPFWNYFCQLSASSLLSKVTFYIYNSNPNDVDELIAVGTIQFEQLMTKTLTTCEVMLYDASQNYLRSTLILQHCDSHPKENCYSPTDFTARTAIRIDLLMISGTKQKQISWLKNYPEKHLKIEYADNTPSEQLKQLSEKYPETTLRYCSGIQNIGIDLCLSKEIILKGEISISNIIKNSCTKVKYHYKNYEIVALLCLGVISNGFLPDQHSSMVLEVDALSVTPISRKMAKNWIIIVYGVFGSEVIRELKKPIRIFIQNNIELYFQYIELDGESGEGWDKEEFYKSLEPTNSFTLPINSINWSQKLQSSEKIQMFSESKGLTYNVQLKMSLLPPQAQNNLAPSFQNPPISYYPGDQAVRLHTIKMSGACFSQIFTEKTIFKFMLISSSQTEEITIFPEFQLRNSTEYVVTSTSKIMANKNATLCLLTFDHDFGPEKSEGVESPDYLENHIIFKMIGDSVTTLGQGKLLYNEKFLAYAKRISLTKVCKRFNQMVKDRTLQLKIGAKLAPKFNRNGGSLTIHNCILQGVRNHLEVTMIFDANQLHLKGDTGRYLMSKPYKMKLKENGVQIKLAYDGTEKTIHSDFEDLFGSPQLNKMYKISFPVGSKDQLNVFYSYQPSKSTKIQPMSEKKDLNKIALFNEKTPLFLLPKSFTVNHENYSSFFLRVTKGNTIYESLEENPLSNLIRFRRSEKMFFGKQSFSNKYIFFNVYCKNSEGNVIIYNGHLDSKSIIGKGCYEVLLSTHSGDENSRKKGILLFQVLNDSINTSQFSREGKIKNLTAIKVNLKSIRFSQKTFFKAMMKYYLTVEINSEACGIFEIKSKKDETLILEEQVKVKRDAHVSWKLFSSLKPISKEQFWGNTEKELIGAANQNWAQVVGNDHYVLLKFMPPRDLKMKFNANSLAIIERTVKLLLDFSIEYLEESDIEILQRKPKLLDIQVLHSAAALVTINEIIPHFSASKTLEFSLQPFNFTFCSFARLPLNKEFMVPVENMKIKTTLTKKSKNSFRYQRESFEKTINLRGKQLKTEQKFGLKLNYPSLCLIKADIIILNNRFTSYPKGKVSVTSLSCKSQIKEVQIRLVKNRQKINQITKNSEQQIAQNKEEEPFRFHMAGKKEISLSKKETKQFRTSEVSNCLYIVAVMENRTRIRGIIELAKLSEISLQNSFKSEWMTDGIWFCLTGEYEPQMTKQLENEDFKYNIEESEEKTLAVTYHKKDEINMVRQAFNKQKILPDRKRGFRIIVQIPKALFLESKIKRVWVKVEQGTDIELRKVQNDSESKDNYVNFLLKSSVQHKVASLFFQQVSQKFAEENPIKIEELEEKNFTRRFLINRNPKIMTYLIQQPYAIATMNNPQTLSFSFTFHQILSSEGENKKILWMENNKYDEILTKQFGLMFKHGEQKHLIRPINENGRLIHKNLHEQNENTVEFGFLEEIDELEIFLYIDSILNQDKNAEDLDEDFHQNWMTMLPVAYGKINLEKVKGDSPLIGCKLKKIENNNDTIDKALNKVIVLPENMYCLGGFGFYNKKWGNVYIELNEVSPIDLENPNSHGSLIFFTIQIQNSTTKQILNKTKTQARVVSKQSPIFFTQNEICFNYLDHKKGSMYSMKITATILSIGQKLTLFEKRVDLTEYLTGKNFSDTPETKKTILTQVKQTQGFGLSKPIQMNFSFENLKGKKVKKNVIDQGRRINKVDMIRFEDLDENGMIKQLINCQHCSHLHQNFEEVKESVIYSSTPELKVFDISGLYLMFQNDSKLVEMAIELMSLSLHKFPKQIISQMKANWIEETANYMLILASAKQLEIGSPPSKISSLDYEEKAQSCTNFQNISQILKIQKIQLYQPNDLFKAASVSHSQSLLTLLNQFCELSEIFRNKFFGNIQSWNQCYLYKADVIFKKYLYLLEHLYNKKQMPEEVRKQILSAGLERNVGMVSIIRFWSQMTDKEQKHRYMCELTKVYGSKLNHQMYANDFLQAFKTLLTYQNIEKITNIQSGCWKPATEICMVEVEKAFNLVGLNNYGELLVKLIGLGHIKEAEKDAVVGIFRKKSANTHEKSMKSLISSFITSICGKDPLANSKNPSNNNKTESKNSFFKKYLITS